MKQPKTPAELKAFIKEAFAKVFDDMDSDETTYATYFSKDYVQYVDGKQLNYTEFVEHMSALKSATQSISIEFKYLLAEGNQVASVHIANAIKKNGDRVHAQVNALFVIKDGEIAVCDELTHLIHGDAADRDLGSRR